MWWILPLAITVLATLGVIWFLWEAEGEDTMAAPIVFMAWFILSFGSWGIYGVIRFLLWVAS